MGRERERYLELKKVINTITNEPTTMFYGLMLAEIPKEFGKVQGCSTACLTSNTATLGCKIVFDPDFWDNLDEEERKTVKRKDSQMHPERTFVLLHELNHYFRNHWLFRSELGWNALIGNLATDASINSAIVVQSEELVKKKSSLKIRTLDSGIYPHSFPELNLEDNRESKYYYDILMKAKKEKEASKDRGEDSKYGEKGNGRGTSGSSQLDAQLDNNEDIHRTWADITQGLSDVEKDIIKKRIESQIERIAEETSKNQGTVPLDIQGVLKKIGTDKPVVSWKEVIRRFAGSVPSNDMTVNRKRPSKRFPDAFATKILQKVSMVNGTDSSGSVSNNDLDKLNAETHHIWKAGANCDYFAWDAEPGEIKQYKGKLDFARVKMGGTRLSCSIEHINTNYRKYGWNCAVVCSDGHIEGALVKCKIPLLIVITPTGSINFPNPHNYKITRMN